MLIALLVSFGSSGAWADSYTITFATNSGDGTSASTSTACSTVVSDGASYLSGNLVTVTSAYYAGSNGLKLGTSSAAGVIKMNLTSSVKPTSIVVNAKRYNSTKAATIAVNGNTAQSLTADFANYTFSYDGKTDVSYIQLNSSKYCWVSSVTVNYTPAKTSTTLTLNKTATTLTANGATETLTATVTPDGGDALVGPSITWTSSDETVATVAAGVVTPLKEGSTTITASYAGDETYDESSNTCAVTVTDARTAVNLSTFTATNTTLIVGGSPSSTATSVTNDQVGWTADYTYESSNTSVATVNESGVITAVAKGTATITCSLNVSLSDASYKAGSTTNKSIEITVNNPSYTATFNVNDDALLSSSATFEEGATITFPDDPSAIDGKVFKGWVATPIAGTQVAAPSFVSSPEMGNSDVTYYAVFAEIVPGDEVTDTKTITTSTANIPTEYGSANTFTEYSLDGIKFKIQQMYLTSVNGVKKLQWRAEGNSNGTGTMYNTDALGKIQSVVLTYDASDTNKNFTVKVGDSENPSSGTSITPTNVGSVYTFDCSSYNKNYFVLTNGEYAGYLSSIAITYKVIGPTTYTNYCTTVSDLPLAVVTLSTESITMTWGESGKTLTASATVNDEPLDETITFTPSSGNLTIDGSGNISCDEPGSYTITATVAATGEHQAGQAVCNVTVNKKENTLAFAEATATAMVADGDYTQTATATPDAYDGDITYEITSSTSADAIIGEDTGELLFENTGVIVVTATAEETTYYNEKTASYTLYVKTTPTLSASDQSIAYGETYTLDTSSFLSGDITLVPTSTTIATVDGLTLTSQAVGSTVVTVNAAANDTYVVGSTTFTLTVTAPTGATTNSEAKESIFYESFDQSNGTDGWSSSAGNGTANFDNDGWTTENSVGGGATCIKLAASKNAGAVTTPNFTVESGVTYTLTFKAGSWSGDGSSLTLQGTNTGTLSQTNFSLPNASYGSYSVTFTPSSNSSSAKIKFSAASGKRLFLDEVRIARPITSTTVTTTGGYATYCYQYPLNLDGISGAKAYKVSEIDLEKEKVRLTQITGTIKGGVPFILMSDGDDATFDIPLADESSTVPASNLLVGTLAPTFVEQVVDGNTNFAYSKSKECFIMINENGNTVPANRAYLPIDLGGGSSVKAFTLSFDTETGINEIGSESGNTIFNLAGQRVNKAQKGLYIMNGKKVLVK